MNGDGGAGCEMGNAGGLQVRVEHVSPQRLEVAGEAGVAMVFVTVGEEEMVTEMVAVGAGTGVHVAVQEAA